MIQLREPQSRHSCAINAMEWRSGNNSNEINQGPEPGRALMYSYQSPD
ncbi:hypothetical protein SynROS8604_01195 [Synechococcus sp. ROS8604]|nr:hypothetical protein SynROS8604_01195 [Synechococcus sp. ROS8604]